MAQRTTTVLLDDLDQSSADESVEFGLDGVAYEIDLNGAHARALRDELAPYISHARRRSSDRARHTTAPTTRRAAVAPATVDREQNKAIREWAARHGHPLSSRGRIPAAVSDAFHAGEPTALPSASTAAEAKPPAAAAGADASAAVAEPQTKRVGPDGLTGDERERIRAWALEEGIEVKTRGRLTKDLITNYRAVQTRR